MSQAHRIRKMNGVLTGNESPDSCLEERARAALEASSSRVRQCIVLDLGPAPSNNVMDLRPSRRAVPEGEQARRTPESLNLVGETARLRAGQVRRLPAGLDRQSAIARRWEPSPANWPSDSDDVPPRVDQVPLRVTPAGLRGVPSRSR